ncbi:MAG: serine/threonine protein kinase [Acidobacteria bacterium]|nr:MAG: serine/threonine protein kinase [Acidobacteriota bacterium]
MAGNLPPSLCPYRGKSPASGVWGLGIIEKQGLRRDQPDGRGRGLARSSLVRLRAPSSTASLPTSSPFRGRKEVGVSPTIRLVPRRQPRVFAGRLPLSPLSSPPPVSAPVREAIPRIARFPIHQQDPRSATTADGTHPALSPYDPAASKPTRRPAASRSPGASLEPMTLTSDEPALRPLEGKYEILEKLGEGGMGAIYRVRHKLLGELRVVKLIRPQVELTDTARERFLREAKAASRLRHARVAQLYDFSIEEDGSSYIIMEHIAGKDLSRVLEDHGPPSLELGVEILCQGLEAIQLLHSQGFVHRDIAPDNLMLSRDLQGGPDVKLIDLGIIKATAKGDSLGGNTAIGSFVGKARYTAPEQFKEGGSQNLSPVSDLYGFGVLAFELLTGTCPIAGKSFADVLSNQLFKPPMEFDEADPAARVPGGLRQVIVRLLAKAPEERPETAGEVLAVFARLRPPAQERDALAREVGRLLGDPEEDTADEAATVLISRDEVRKLEEQWAREGPPPGVAGSASPAAPRPARGATRSRQDPTEAKTEPGRLLPPQPQAPAAAADSRPAPAAAAGSSAEPAPRSTASPPSPPVAPTPTQRPSAGSTPRRPPRPPSEMETTLHVRRPAKRSWWQRLLSWLPGR